MRREQQHSFPPRKRLLKIFPCSCPKFWEVNTLARFVPPKISQFPAKISEQFSANPFSDRAIKLQRSQQIFSHHFTAGRMPQKINFRQRSSQAAQYRSGHDTPSQKAGAPKLTPVKRRCF